MRPMHLTSAERKLSQLVTDFAMGAPSKPQDDYRNRLVKSRKRLEAARAAFLGINLTMDAYGTAFREMEAAAKAHRDLMAKVFTQ